MPRDRALVGQIHAIKRPVLPSGKVSFDAEWNAKGPRTFGQHKRRLHRREVLLNDALSDLLAKGVQGLRELGIASARCSEEAHQRLGLAEPLLSGLGQRFR